MKYIVVLSHKYYSTRGFAQTSYKYYTEIEASTAREAAETFYGAHANLHENIAYGPEVWFFHLLDYPWWTIYVIGDNPSERLRLIKNLYHADNNLKAKDYIKKYLQELEDFEKSKKNKEVYYAD